MPIKTFIVDAFTEVAFRGNPAGVCMLEHELEASLMQSIANELNLSETAFLKQSPGAQSSFDIRFFTPTDEVPLCGHATLAAASVVFHLLKQKQAQFSTKANLLIPTQMDNSTITMNFPLYDSVPYEATVRIKKAIGIQECIETRFTQEMETLLIRIGSKEALVNLKPNFPQLVAASKTFKEIIVTAKSSDTNYDFYSRCFCPWIGINEDPVTGAAHSILAKYWGDSLKKTILRAFQSSSRGGWLDLKILPQQRLEIRSAAKLIFEGILHI